MNAVVTTSLLVVSLVSASAALSALLSNRLDLAAALPFSAGALAGMIVGRKAAARLADGLLLRGFAVLAVAMAIALFIKAFGQHYSF